MTGEYGYQSRPDMPDRPVQGGVVEPRNQWPRKIPRESGDGGFVRQILQLLNSSNAEIIGAGLTLADSTSGGTIVTTANGWDATFGRTGRITDLTGTNPAAVGSNIAYSTWQLSPAPLAATNYTVLPCSVRLSSVVGAMSTTIAAFGSGGAAFGLSNYALLPVAIPTNAFVGFVSTWTHPDAYGSWSTWVASTSGGFTRATNTAFATNTAHLLEVEFDGAGRLINWYVDGELVDSYAPASADLFTHLTYGSSIYFLCNSTLTTVTRMIYLCDTVPLVTVTLTDLDGTA